MQTIAKSELRQVSGGELSRETEQLMASIAVGTVTGGHFLTVGVAHWLMGQYYDFAGGISSGGPSGPSSNHLTTRQYRTMRRE